MSCHVLQCPVMCSKLEDRGLFITMDGCIFPDRRFLTTAYRIMSRFFNDRMFEDLEEWTRGLDARSGSGCCGSGTPFRHCRFL